MAVQIKEKQRVASSPTRIKHKRIPGQFKAKAPVPLKSKPERAVNRTVLLEDLVPTAVKAVKPRKDFFGRVIDVSCTSKKVAKRDQENAHLEENNQQASKKRNTGEYSCDVLFKFKEGYSNAVRKPFYFSDLRLQQQTK